MRADERKSGDEHETKELLPTRKVGKNAKNFHSDNLDYSGREVSVVVDQSCVSGNRCCYGFVGGLSTTLVSHFSTKRHLRASTLSFLSHSLLFI